MADSTEIWYDWQIFVDKSDGQEWDGFIRALYWNKKFLLKTAWDDNRYNDTKVMKSVFWAYLSMTGRYTSNSFWFT